MKKIMICTALLLSMFLSACGSSQVSTTNNTESGFLTSEVSQIATPSALISGISTEASSSSGDAIDFEAMRKQIYDEMFVLAIFTYTPDYAKEFARLWEKEHNYQLSESEEDRWCPLVYRIDPFSEKLLTHDDIDKITSGMPFGEVRQLFGNPNYGIMWRVDPDEGNMSNFYGHWYYILDNGELLRISLNGLWEFRKYVGPGTTWPVDLNINYRLNYYVDEVDVLSLQELLQMKEYYMELKGLDHRYDPREEGAWLFDEWPEIFVTKYGLE